jgi:hypothetical protein
VKPRVARALRFLLVVLLAVAAGFAGSQPAGAIGFHVPNRWWVDLKPWGDGQITYLLCAIPYELPPEWQQGVENWDAAMTDMDFDLQSGGCFASADTWLVWNPGDKCPAGNIACTWPELYVDHETWWEMQRVVTYFNRYEYYSLGTWTDEWQVAVSAHEWGHVMNLANDDWGNQCMVNEIMGNPVDVWHAPCLLGPSPREVENVIFNYGLLDSDGDSLGLGPSPGGFFPDATEELIGTDPEDGCPDNSSDDAWPPDFNNSKSVTAADLVAFRQNAQWLGKPYNARYDLNASGAITSADLVIFKKYYLMSCTG